MPGTMNASNPPGFVRRPAPRHRGWRCACGTWPRSSGLRRHRPWARFAWTESSAPCVSNAPTRRAEQRLHPPSHQRRPGSSTRPRCRSRSCHRTGTCSTKRPHRNIANLDTVIINDKRVPLGPGTGIECRLAVLERSTFSPDLAQLMFEIRDERPLRQVLAVRRRHRHPRPRRWHFDVSVWSDTGSERDRGTDVNFQKNGNIIRQNGVHNSFGAHMHNAFGLSPLSAPRRTSSMCTRTSGRGPGPASRWGAHEPPCSFTLCRKKGSIK